MKATKATKIVRKKDHLEIHYEDGRVIKTLEYHEGYNEAGIIKIKDR